MEIYAFWQYDLPPYMLGARVVYSNPDGTVQVQGFLGYTIKPVKLLLNEAGERAMLELKRLRTEYNDDDVELRRKYKELGLQAIGERIK